MSNKRVTTAAAIHDRTKARNEGDCPTEAQGGAETIARLARLSAVEYDQAREDEAKRLGIRVSTLDTEVGALRPTADADSLAVVEDLEPWPEPIDIAGALAETAALLRRHIILPTGADTAISLWIATAYAYFPLRIFPKLLITSPEKRCGKTTLLEAINGLAPRVMFSSSLTPAVIFRAVEKYRPTLIIDEADTFVVGNEEMRGIINCGHTKIGANVIRCVGDAHDLGVFSTWAPMVIAAIKLLGDTITDRSVVIRLRRKTAEESVIKLGIDFRGRMEPLRRRLLRWSMDNEARVATMLPTMPEHSNDRALDNWGPLFAVAELAGGEWPEKTHDAFKFLQVEDDDNDSIGPLLLADIEKVLKGFDDRIHSANLVDALVELEERPWSEWRGGKPMTTNSLSKILKTFGVRSHQLKIAGDNKRGYEVGQFTDAFNRYLGAVDHPS